MVSKYQPKILVQTAGHVSGATYYYQRQDVRPDPWDEKTTIHGVSIHPRYGGWFAFRGALIFKNVTWTDLAHRDPVDVVSSYENRKELLERYNFRWKDWTYRDIIPVEKRYSDEQKEFFQTSPGERLAVIERIRQRHQVNKAEMEDKSATYRIGYTTELSYFLPEAADETEVAQTIFSSEFDVPLVCYPRCCHIGSYAKPLLDRYTNIFKSLDLNDPIPKPNFGNVTIIFVTQSKGDYLDTSNIVLKHAEKVEQKELKQFNKLERPKGESLGPTIFIATSQHSRLIADLGPFNILINETHSVVQSFVAPIVSRKDLAQKISALLEQYLLYSFDDRMAILKCMMESDFSVCKNDSKEANFNECLETKDNGRHDDLQKAPVSNDKGSNHSADHSVDEVCKQLLKCPTDRLLRVQNDAEELYGEIKGMLYRSGVELSEFKHANVEVIKLLDESTAKEILSVRGVTRVGYRFRILDIFVDDSLELTDKQKTEDELKDLMKERSIQKYAIHCERREIKMLREVGSEICNTVCGTLGGFAEFGEDRDLCILLSRHIAIYGDKIFISTDSNPWLYFADVMCLESEKNDIDIALAKVKQSERHSCQLKFKDEANKHLPSTMRTFKSKNEEMLWMSGLFVHIWGAKTKPGLGRITNPQLFQSEMQETYLGIKNRNCENGDDTQQFAKPGDSGAIVCANDINGEVIHTVAILIGSSDLENQATYSYVALKLEKGLEFLEELHKGKIKLF